MADKSKIEWTEATWNPVTGCTQVSPGCGLPRWEGDRPGECYAKTFAERWRGTPGHPYENGFDVQLRPERLDQPLRWKRPRMIFVNSMSDLFHDKISATFIAQVFAVMAATPRHTYQLLTKRHGRLKSLLGSPEFPEVVQLAFDELAEEHDIDVIPGPWPLPNVWVGVSVENQQWADIRIPALMETPAAVRWISAEPLLGPVDIREYLDCDDPDAPGFDFFDGQRYPALGWVVAGGESGPGARPMHPDWSRSLRDQCQQAGVPFLFKQRGAYTWEMAGGGGWPESDLYVNAATGEALPEDQVPDTGSWQGVWRVGKGRAGRELDGREWNEYPAVVA